MGKPSEMILDDKAVDLNTQVYDNAVIKFIKGKDGENARAKVQDFIPEAEKTSITINGRSFNIDPAIEMNGKPASPDEDISEDAVVIIRPKELILSDIFNIISFKPDKMPGKLITNINGIAAGFSDTIKCGDAIDIYWQSQQNL